MAGKMGKMGILWEIDRTTGAFVAAHDLGYQTLIDVDPQTGEVTYRPGMIPQAGVELEFCPDFRGIRNWPASAYHPQTQLLYIPIHPTCVRGTFTEIDRVLQAPYYPNSGWRSQGTTAHPDSPDHRGHLSPWTSTAARSCGGIHVHGPARGSAHDGRRPGGQC